MLNIFIKIKNNGLYGSSFIIILLLYGIAQAFLQDKVFATSDMSSQRESWDRLLIEEVPSIKDNVDNIVNALNEGNYSEVGKQIDDIQTGDIWFNIRNELDSRQATDLVSRFNNSLFELDRLSESEDSIALAVEQAQILSESMDDIVNKLSNPVVDIQRMVLTTSVIGIIIGSGLFIIPRVRKRFNIKY